MVHGATADIADGNVQVVKEAQLGDMTLSNLEVIFADFHVFKLWGLDQEPAMLIGMDMLGVLERLVIDYRRNEVSMYGERPRADARHARRQPLRLYAARTRRVFAVPRSAMPRPGARRDDDAVSSAA